MTGKELKAKRKSIGLTQKKLAELTGIDPRDICMFETTRRPIEYIHSVKHEKLKSFFKNHYKFGRVDDE